MDRLNGYLREHRRIARVARKQRIRAENISDPDKRADIMGRAAEMALWADKLRQAAMVELECLLLDRSRS